MAPNHSPFPDSPPISPPNGLDSRDGLCTELFPQKPNILYIMADQLAAPLLKMYNPKSQIQTPHLDQLAELSVKFSSAYCNAPLCAPSRMAMITGQLCSKIGSYDNASQISSAVPTYAHYLRNAGYETVLAGKMHFVGDQLHGYERRLTADIYPADFGWAVNWDEPGQRLEWYHNASSILQAGPCVRSNQLDYDEEVMHKSKQYLYDYVRQSPEETRPFCLTVSLTHPHDPYAIEQKYWDLYEDVDIDLPQVRAMPEEQQDAHSKRLLHVCDLTEKNFTDAQIKRARRAYYGAVSYVDDCVGKLLDTLQRCGLADNTVIMFSGDHGDMLGERGLWYKMSYFEASVRVPLLISYPQRFTPHVVTENVSTLDILPTLAELVGEPLVPGVPLDGTSLIQHLYGLPGHDTVFAEYMGEGTISPMMMIRRGPYKYITCPADPPQLFNLHLDPLELHNIAANPQSPSDHQLLSAFEAEAATKWDFASITASVLLTQRQRRFVWSALTKGRFESWDWTGDVKDDGRTKFIRSQTPLDVLELKARYPAVPADGVPGATKQSAEVVALAKNRELAAQPKRVLELAGQGKIAHFR